MQNLSAKQKVVRTGNTDILLPVKSGMSLEQAFSAIAGNADIKGQGSATLLIYTFFLDKYAFYIHHSFSSSLRVVSYSMDALDAINGAESASECYDFYKTYIAILEKKVGSVDFQPRIHKENGYVSSKAVFTYSDSSNIAIEMRYPESQYGPGKCMIKIYSGLPWVDSLCSGSSHLCDRPTMPLMRTPWSRFK